MFTAATASRFRRRCLSASGSTLGAAGGPGMRIEDHLLALAQVGDEKELAAVAESRLRDLDHLIDDAELDRLVARTGTPHRARRLRGMNTWVGRCRHSKRPM